MVDVITSLQYTLNTEPRVNAVINSLISKAYLHPNKFASPLVKHLTLHCCRPNCGKVFLDCTNKNNQYSLPIAHMFVHKWEAGRVMMEAVNAEATAMSCKRQGNNCAYISPPPKRVNTRSAPSTPEQSSSVLERAGSCSTQEKHDCMEDTAHMIAANCMPFHWFSKPVSRKWFASMGAVVAPTKHEAVAAVNMHGDRALQKVIKHLGDSEYPCTMAVDSVTNVNHHKIYSVVLLNKGQPWFLGSWSIKHAVDTAITAESMLGPLILQLRANHVRVSALTTDNATKAKCHHY